MKIDIALPLHHIGIATADLEQSVKLYQDALGWVVTGRERVEDFGVEAVLMELPDSHQGQENTKNTLSCSTDLLGHTRIELIAPLSNKSGVHTFIEKRGAGIHHLCFETAEISIEMQRLEKLGLTVIGSGPRKGAFSKMVVFFHPKALGGVLIELCQNI